MDILPPTMTTPRLKNRLKLKSADQLYLSPDGRWLASSKVQGRVQLYDLAARAHALSVKPLKNIDGLAFSPCSRYLSVINDRKQWCVLRVPDGQVLLQGQARESQSVFQALNFLPDGSGLFVVDNPMRLDTRGPEPRWVHEHEATRWRWPDGAAQGTRPMPMPFTTARVHADYPRGRYWLPHTLSVPVDQTNSTAASALCVWQGDVLTADFTPVPPPPAAAVPPGQPGQGLWKSIEALSLAPDGDAAVLLAPGYRSSSTYDLLLLCGQTFQAQAFTTLCPREQYHVRDCALGQGVVAVSLRTWTGGAHADVHIAFYARADLRPLGRLPLPADAYPSAIVWHPSGQGLGLALEAQSVYHFDCPQQPEALAAWLRAHGRWPDHSGALTGGNGPE